MGAFGGFPQITECLGQLCDLVTGIEAAGVRQHPNAGRSHSLSLRSEDRPGTPECRSVGADAEQGNPSWRVTHHFAFEEAPAMNQVSFRELISTSRRLGDQVGNADMAEQEKGAFPRRQKPLGKAGIMKGSPEAVSRPREMITDGGGIETRINSAEQNDEAGRDNIGHFFV